MKIKLPLSALQKKVLKCIFDYLRNKEYPPTIMEIQKELGIANPGTVHTAVTGLERKNYVYRNRKKIARNIRLTPLGEEIYNQPDQLNLF